MPLLQEVSRFERNISLLSSLNSILYLEYIKEAPDYFLLFPGEVEFIFPSMTLEYL